MKSHTFSGSINSRTRSLSHTSLITIKYFLLQYLRSYGYDIKESRKSFLNSWRIIVTSCVNSILESTGGLVTVTRSACWHNVYNSMHSTRTTLHRTIDRPRVPSKNIAPTKRCAIISGTMSLECIF